MFSILATPPHQHFRALQDDNLSFCVHYFAPSLCYRRLWNYLILICFTLKASYTASHPSLYYIHNMYTVVHLIYDNSPNLRHIHTKLLYQSYPPPRRTCTTLAPKFYICIVNVYTNKLCLDDEIDDSLFITIHMSFAQCPRRTFKCKLTYSNQYFK